MHKKYEKIQPKLNQSTAAASSKVRYKFDGQGKDALTMAGNLLGTTSRIIPSWRKGQWIKYRKKLILRYNFYNS